MKVRWWLVSGYLLCTMLSQAQEQWNPYRTVSLHYSVKNLYTRSFLRDTSIAAPSVFGNFGVRFEKTRSEVFSTGFITGYYSAEWRNKLPGNIISSFRRYRALYLGPRINIHKYIANGRIAIFAGGAIGLNLVVLKNEYYFLGVDPQLFRGPYSPFHYSATAGVRVFPSKKIGIVAEAGWEAGSLLQCGIVFVL